MGAIKSASTSIADAMSVIQAILVAIAASMGFKLETPGQHVKKPRPQQPPPMPRPPFMSDDDPLVLNGTYQ